MGRKETNFCGYSVPHPSEPKMNVRLQTAAGKPAISVLKDGLEEMVEICDLLEFTLTRAIDEYYERTDAEKEQQQQQQQEGQQEEEEAN
jgi:DNA-directed RNA polymerase I and III subunit RPAC2